MYRETWRATVHGIRELDKTEHTYTYTNGHGGHSQEGEYLCKHIISLQFLTTVRSCIILIAFTLECRD